MPNLIVECSGCAGTGKVVAYIRGWEVPIEKLTTCRDCGGIGTKVAMCSCCCREPATVKTDDHEFPYLCDECAAYVAREDAEAKEAQP